MYIDNAILITIYMSDKTNSDHKLPIVEKGISIVAIKDLEGCNFRVPNYQRGYRWTRQQVKDLINDIFEFIEFLKNGQKGIYCIQPLVVQKSHNEEGKDCWDVIDGQQRLTTIFIILKFFHCHLYGLQYQTRFQSADYLNSLANHLYAEGHKFDNIDFYHMYEAFEEVSSKLNVHQEQELDKFEKVLLSKVKFIWYAIDGEQNPIDVFTRLNIDKISLTPSELIKALLLNRNNFSSEQDFDKIHMQQQEIATGWDAIENQLQMDNFWLFFHEVGYHSATRIDYLFEILCDQQMLPVASDEEYGSDEARTFRYVYAYFQINGFNSGTIHAVWVKIKSIFDTLNEWFNDLELYHYVGYILSRPDISTRKVANSSKVKEKIYDLWRKWVEKDMTVSKYKEWLHDEIQKLIDDCKNIDKEYETKGCPKTQCRPILLLHNVLTVIRQGRMAKETYAQDIFFKFPFNLYKLEKWDVEHIDSNTSNDLQEFDQQKEWLLNNYVIADGLKEKIKAFCEDNEKDDNRRTKVFESLRKKLQGSSTDLLNEDDKDNEKNQLWNFALLDERTNRGYGNAIFPAKRRIIIGKEQGKYYPCPKCTAQNGFEVMEPTNATSSFILPCTKQAFMKYYSPASGTMTAWTRSDAKAYRQNIIDLLTEFGFKIEKNNE